MAISSPMLTRRKMKNKLKVSSLIYSLGEMKVVRANFFINDNNSNSIIFIDLRQFTFLGGMVTFLCF